MHSCGIVEAMNIAGDSLTSSIPGLVGGSDFLAFEGGKKAFGDRIVPAICLAAHALHEPRGLDRAPKAAAGILAAPIRVEQTPRGRWRICPSVEQCLTHQFVGHSLGEAAAELGVFAGRSPPPDTTRLPGSECR